MKFLVDSCVGLMVVQFLRDAGYDVKWVQELDSDPGDSALIDMAVHEERAIITLDKDFGELAVVFGKEHYGILRLVGFDINGQVEALKRVLKSHYQGMLVKSLITVDPNKIRTRPQNSQKD